METIDTLIKRRSVRGFSSKVVDSDTLEKILLAGKFAPSGRGRQSAIMILVQDKDTLAELRAENAKIMGAEYDPFYGATAVIIVLACKDIPTYIYDGTLVMGNLMNAAFSLGVDSCWIHRAKEEFEGPWGKALLKKLGIEGNYEGIGHVALGYRADTLPEPKPRKDDFVYYI